MNLYEQLVTIQRQCKVRGFSATETAQVMGLCIYSCPELFPCREVLPFEDHVLASTRDPPHPEPHASLTDNPV